MNCAPTPCTPLLLCPHAKGNLKSTSPRKPDPFGIWACDIKWGQVVVQASRLPVVAGWKPAPQPVPIPSTGKTPFYVAGPRNCGLLDKPKPV